MATRPVFLPRRDRPGVIVRLVEFRWHAGLSATQKKRSIRELHDAAHKMLPATHLLEISTKSDDEIGVELSAFNLSFTTKRHGKEISVESAFQGSKVFENGGPYTDLYLQDSRSAKIDKRVRDGKNLLRFEFFRQSWPTRPITAFYDWLYIKALSQHEELSRAVLEYEAFTDIEFNPERSLNCQAYSAALYVSLTKNREIDRALSSGESFLELVEKIPGYGVTTPRAMLF